ncbi:META domain-containing protein [Psychroserpens sp. NJDZ02]|uniref:META domain-containing protein n=1 Tax=Psychroserpens sp. NJDZ02 TaxID=2570561 RepID=UPI0010A899CC|nr:META domain-containing protein [Psychroserpens sp. NJDZ02]QCE40999.1 META domain-containing protein [Psychroserpens sp. NJDZ02]
MKTITILLFSILLNSCGSTQDAKSSLNPDMSTAPLNGTYSITTLDSKATTNTKLSLSFDSATNRIYGFSGCNNFFGTYTMTADKLTFSQIGSTKKMCPEAENAIESTFLETLQETTNYKVSGNAITLLNNKREVLSGMQASDTEESQKQDNGMTFRYSAATRGSYTLIEIDQNTIKSQFNRADKPNIKTCTKADWSTLKELTEAINIASLDKLEPPSKAHQYDGAAAASLTIIVNGTQHSTPSFDAGNPPKTIAVLVNKLIALTK